MEEILEFYYGDNAKRLHNMVDGILRKLGFFTLTDTDDFYSLANEVFADVIGKYDSSQAFDSFLYACLCNRFKTEMTARNRQKRQADKMAVSIDTLINEDDNSTLGDIIADSFSVEREILEKMEEGSDERILTYLSKLSKLQRDVLRLNIEGYLPNEIKEKLHITEKQYSDCNAAIHSYKNVSVLF